MTGEQRAAMIESLGQAQHFRAQVMRARVELQNPERITFYDRHIERMTACLAGDTVPS